MTNAEAIEILKNLGKSGPYEQYEAICMAISALEKKIPADVVEVVRCRDCELWNEWDSAGKESLGNYVCSCAHWSVEDGVVLYTRPTDYCSYGERKGGDGDE